MVKTIFINIGFLANSVPAFKTMKKMGIYESEITHLETHAVDIIPLLFESAIIHYFDGF
jgi:hypothetical protein